MMKCEFERIAGYEVSDKTYNEIIEPMYLATELSKRDFVKLLNRKALETKKVRKPNIKCMLVRDRSGYTKTPNGCYYHIQYVDMVDVDIKTGKIVIAPLDDETLREIGRTHDLNNGYHFDFDYTQCVDTHKKPIVLIC